jgi:hypothetical protein
MRSSVRRILEQFTESQVGPAVQFVFDADPIFPDQIVHLWWRGGDEERGAIQVADQTGLAQVGQFLDEPLVAMCGEFHGATFVQPDEILQTGDVGGLIGELLLPDHYGGEDEHCQHEEKVSLVSEKLHVLCVSDRGRNRDHSLPL